MILARPFKAGITVNHYDFVASATTEHFNRHYATKQRPGSFPGLERPG